MYSAVGGSIIGVGVIVTGLRIWMRQGLCRKPAGEIKGINIVTEIVSG
jgi:hypothetical protein